MAPRLAATELRELADETAALQWVQGSKADVARFDAEDSAWLISRGWWCAARELVTASHQAPFARNQQQAIESIVRREVGNLKRQADELLLALSPQESEKIGVVRCSLQWAQNSTAIFLTIKFAHRWSSPGALKVHGEKVGVSPCCFNFSADGDHSQLKKRYALDLHFHKEVNPDHWYWQHAAAGRMTVEIRKQEPSVWPQLCKEKQSNMAVWDSMRQRWAKEVERFADDQKKAQKKSKRGGASSEEDEEDEKEREAERHSELMKKCVVGPRSPWLKNRMAHLCKEYWPPKLEGRMGKQATWLVLFFSSSELECEQRSDKCQKVRAQWSTVDSELPELTRAKVAVVDCDVQKNLCEQQGVGFLPYVRKYKQGKRKVYRGEWDLESLSKFVST